MFRASKDAVCDWITLQIANKPLSMKGLFGGSSSCACIFCCNWLQNYSFAANSSRIQSVIKLWSSSTQQLCWHGACALCKQSKECLAFVKPVQLKIYFVNEDYDRELQTEQLVLIRRESSWGCQRGALRQGPKGTLHNDLQWAITVCKEPVQYIGRPVSQHHSFSV